MAQLRSEAGEPWALVDVAEENLRLTDFEGEGSPPVFTSALEGTMELEGSSCDTATHRLRNKGAAALQSFHGSLDILETAWKKVEKGGGLIPVKAWERIGSSSLAGLLAEASAITREAQGHSRVPGTGPLVSELYKGAPINDENDEKPASKHPNLWTPPKQTPSNDLHSKIVNTKSPQEYIPTAPVSSPASETCWVDSSSKPSPHLQALLGSASSSDDLTSPTDIPNSGDLDFLYRRINNRKQTTLAPIIHENDTAEPRGSSKGTRDSPTQSPHPFSPRPNVAIGISDTESEGLRGLSPSSRDSGQDATSGRHSFSNAASHSLPYVCEGRNPRHRRITSGGAPIASRFTPLCTNNYLASRTKRRIERKLRAGKNEKRAKGGKGVGSNGSSSSRNARKKVKSRSSGEGHPPVPSSTRARHSVFRKLFRRRSVPLIAKIGSKQTKGKANGPHKPSVKQAAITSNDGGNSRKTISFTEGRRRLSLGRGSVSSSSAGESARDSGANTEESTKRTRKSVTAYATVLRKVIGMHEKQIRKLQKERRREQSRRRAELLKWQRYAQPDLYRISDLLRHASMLELTARLRTQYACCEILEREVSLVQLALNGDRMLDARSFGGRIKSRGRATPTEIAECLPRHPSVSRKRTFHGQVEKALARVQALHDAIKKRCSKPSRQRESERRSRLKALIIHGCSAARAIRNARRVPNGYEDHASESSNEESRRLLKRKGDGTEEYIVQENSSLSSGLYFHPLDETHQMEFQSLMLDQRGSEGRFLARTFASHCSLSPEHPATATPEPPHFKDLGFLGSRIGEISGNLDGAGGHFAGDEEREGGGIGGTVHHDSKEKDPNMQYKNIRSYIVREGLKIAYGSEEFPESSISCLALYADRLLTPLLRSLVKKGKSMDDIRADAKFLGTVNWAKRIATPEQIGILPKFCPDGYFSKAREVVIAGGKAFRCNEGSGGSDRKVRACTVYPKATWMLSSLNKCRSATDALRCLLESIKTLREEAEGYALRKVEGSTKGKNFGSVGTPVIETDKDRKKRGVELDADMLFPIVVWVFLQADIPGINGWLGIISRFSDQFVTTYGETGMALALAQAAVSHIKSLKPEDFRTIDTSGSLEPLEEDCKVNATPPSVVSVEIMDNGDQKSNDREGDDRPEDGNGEEEERGGEGDPPTEFMLYCPVCKYVIDVAAQKCGNCGAELGPCLDEDGRRMSHILVDAEI